MEDVNEKENIENEEETNDAENTDDAEGVEDASFVQGADDAKSVDNTKDDDNVKQDVDDVEDDDEDHDNVNRDEAENEEDTDSEDENDVENTVNNELVRCIESNLEGGYSTIFACRIRMPGNRCVGVVTMDRNVTISELNQRLDVSFSYRAYYMGRYVNGEILPNDPGMTMRELDVIGTDFAIGVGTEEWNDGIDLEELNQFTDDFQQSRKAGSSTVMKPCLVHNVYVVV